MRSLEVPERVPRWFGWWVALALAVQLALYAASTGPGLAGTSDSVIYLHAANTLRTAGHLLDPDGTPYRFWPPLYPVLLALAGTAGAARVLHGLGLAAGLLGWSWLGRRLLPARLALVLPWALALNTPWLLVSRFVWGETVFLALLAGYAAALFQWLRTRRGSWGLLATALGALLPLARTAGFFVWAGVAVGLLLCSKDLARPQRMRVLAHLAVSLVGGVIWHVYALLLAAPTVYRLNRGWSQLFSSAADYGFVLTRWLVPVQAAWRPLAGWAWAVLLLLLLAALWPRHHALPKEPDEPAASPIAASAGSYLRVLWSIIAAFVLLLLVSTTFTRSASGLYDSERYASALVGPVWLLALHAGTALETWAAKRGRQWLRYGLLVLLGLSLAYNAARAVGNVRALRQLPALAWPVQ